MGQSNLRGCFFGCEFDPKDSFRALRSHSGSVSGYPGHLNEPTLYNIEDPAVMGMPAPIVPVIEKIGPSRLCRHKQRTGLGKPAIQLLRPGIEDRAKASKEPYNKPQLPAVWRVLCGKFKGV